MADTPIPESSPLHDWRPADELDSVPLDTAAIERIRARAYAGNANNWRVLWEKSEALLAEYRSKLILSTSERALACPDCGDEYLHHGMVTVRSRPQEDGPGVRTYIGPNGDASQAGIDEHSAEWLGRRDDLAIELRCETCESVSELRIVQHKGRTLLTAVVTSQGKEEP